MSFSAKFVVATAATMLLTACASGDADQAGKAGVVNANLESMEKAPLIPAGPGTIVVRVSGEAYQGAPEFKVFMDGTEVGAGVVDWALDTETEGFAVTYDGSRVINFSSGSRQRLDDNLTWKSVSFDVDMPEGGPNTVSVFFANDKYKAIEDRMFDRNLIVDWVEINGHRIQAEKKGVVLESVRGTTEEGMEKMLRNGALVFDVQQLLGIAPEKTEETVAEK